MFRMLAFLIAAGAPFAASANNACTAPVITTSANVETSYDAQYQVRTIFRSRDDAVAEFINPKVQTLVTEGPFVWVRGDDGAETAAGDRERRFILGHQYHAMLLRFDSIMSSVEEKSEIQFGDSVRTGRIGQYPTGGEVVIVDGDADDKPAGLIMTLPDETPILVRFDDWRSEESETALPYKIIIEHQENTFTYEYTNVEILEGDVIDFHEQYAAPAFDDVQIYRLHRAMLAAHCRGDAALIAQLSAPTVTIASRGAVTETTPDEMRTRFEGVFSNIDYTAYHDLTAPSIHVAESGDIGWAIVNPRLEAIVKETGEAVSQDWAWVMMAEKIDGVWLHSGNAQTQNRRIDHVTVFRIRRRGAKSPPLCCT